MACFFNILVEVTRAGEEAGRQLGAGSHQRPVVSRGDFTGRSGINGPAPAGFRLPPALTDEG